MNKFKKIGEGDENVGKATKSAADQVSDCSSGRFQIALGKGGSEANLKAGPSLQNQTTYKLVDHLSDLRLDLGIWAKNY